MTFASLSKDEIEATCTSVGNILFYKSNRGIIITNIVTFTERLWQESLLCLVAISYVYGISTKNTLAVKKERPRTKKRPG